MLDVRFSRGMSELISARKAFLRTKVATKEPSVTVVRSNPEKKENRLVDEHQVLSYLTQESI